jgi:IstB-like ATP binding protein
VTPAGVISCCCVISSIACVSEVSVIAAAWRELQAEALVLRLLDAEQTDLQASSLRCQLKAARFPVHRDLTGFDWSKTPLEAHHMQELAKGRYLDTA